MLVTRLRDVEQQLSRATATVQIHIKAESASLGDRSGVGDGDASSAQAAADVRALVAAIERLQGEFQDATARILGLARRHLAAFENRGGDSDETETEDEMEELEGKAETVTSGEECATQGEGGKVSSPSSSCVGIAVVHDVVSPKPLPKRGPKDTEGGARSMGIMPPAERAVVSAIPTRLLTYIQTAKNAKQALGADDEAEHQRAEALVKSMQDRAVKETKQFLSWLLVEKVNAEMAVAFSEATALMVSVVIANDCNNRRGWIERMLKNFINIVKLTKGTTLDENLLGVEESRLQLRKYCDERFPDYVEDMQRYIQLQQSRGLSAGQFQGPIRGLLRQFYEDCIDYSSKQDAVDGKPRTEERWNCVAKIANILSAWIGEVIQAGGVLFVKDAPRIQSAMRRFETRFPGRIPAAFLAHLNRIIDDLDAKIAEVATNPRKLQAKPRESVGEAREMADIEANGQSETSVSPCLEQTTAVNETGGTTKAGKKRARVGYDDGGGPKTKRVAREVTIEDVSLRVASYLTAASEAKRVMCDEGTSIEDQRAKTALKNMKTAAGPANSCVKIWLKNADSVDKVIADQFCDATASMAAVVQCTPGSGLPHAWLKRALGYVRQISRLAAKAEMSQVSSSLLSSASSLEEWRRRYIWSTKRQTACHSKTPNEI